MAKRATVLDVETEVVEEETFLDELPVVEEVMVVEVDKADEADEEACRQRAYEISQSEHSGTPEENWLRAEDELRGTTTAERG